MDTKYNGWTNRQTWNVALWIGNDEGLYNMARAIARRCNEDDSPYEAFANEMRELGATETPDRVAYNDSALDIDELDDMMREL
jgi:hypothetical protein